jgi:hypothetical protein
VTVIGSTLTFNGDKSGVIGRADSSSTVIFKGDESGHTGCIISSTVTSDGGNTVLSQLIFLSSQWSIKGKVLACALCGLGANASDPCAGRGKELRFGKTQLNEYSTFLTRTVYRHSGDLTVRLR